MTETEPAYLADDYDDEQDIDTIVAESSGNYLTTLAFLNVDDHLVDLLVGRFKEVRASSRRQAAHYRQQAQRRKDRIARAVTRLSESEVWFTSTNERIEIKKMTPRHASRSLNLLLNDFGRWVGDRDVAYSDLGLSYPIEKAPVVKALQKRSKARETKRHRELDEVADTVFRAAAAGGKMRIWETIESFTKVHSG